MIGFFVSAVRVRIGRPAHHHLASRSRLLSVVILRRHSVRRVAGWRKIVVPIRRAVLRWVVLRDSVGLRITILRRILRVVWCNSLAPHVLWGLHHPLRTLRGRPAHVATRIRSLWVRSVWRVLGTAGSLIRRNSPWRAVPWILLAVIGRITLVRVLVLRVEVPLILLGLLSVLPWVWHVLVTLLLIGLHSAC